MINLPSGLRKMVGTVSRNSTTIMTVAGIGSFITATVLAVKATKEKGWVYDKAVDEAFYMEATSTEKAMHIAKETVPLYIPAIIATMAGILCVGYANKINLDDKAAVIAAYSAGENALKELNGKMLERFGEDAYSSVMDDIAADDLPAIQSVPYGSEASSDEVLVYDHVTGRYFMSEKSKIEQAEAMVVRRLIDETCVCLNDFYYALGLNDYSSIGDVIGWDAGRCIPSIHYTSMLDERGRPCLVINYSTCLISPKLLEMGASW